MITLNATQNYKDGSEYEWRERRFRSDKTAAEIMTKMLLSCGPGTSSFVFTVVVGDDHEAR